MISNALLNFTHKQSCAYRAVLGKFALSCLRANPLLQYFQVFKVKKPQLNVLLLVLSGI